jgi:hypothetical protein
MKKTAANPPAVLDNAATAQQPDAASVANAADTPAAATAVEVSPAAGPAIAPAIAAEEPPPKCDLIACEAAYFTFTPSDCTYQPSNGPRRLCSKGTPPGARADATPAASAGNGTTAQAAAHCNQSACARAYFTFNPADCTYQPTEGPRRLCTK